MYPALVTLLVSTLTFPPGFGQFMAGQVRKCFHALLTGGKYALTVGDRWSFLMKRREVVTLKEKQLLFVNLSADTARVSGRTLRQPHVVPSGRGRGV